MAKEKKELPKFKTILKNILLQSYQPLIVAIIVIVLDFTKDIREASEGWLARPWAILIIGAAVFFAIFISHFFIELITFSYKHNIETRKIDKENIIFENVVSNIADKDEIARIESMVDDEVVIMSAAFVVDTEFRGMIANNINKGVIYKYIIPKSIENDFKNIVEKIAQYAEVDRKGDGNKIKNSIKYVLIHDKYFIPQSFLMYTYKADNDGYKKYDIYTKLSCANPQSQVYYYENKDSSPIYEQNGTHIYPHGSKAAIKHRLEELLSANAIRDVQ